MIKPVDLETVYTIRHHAMYPSESRDFVQVDGDDSAQHLGFYLGDSCVSVLSIFEDNDFIQIRKFATLPEYQNKGYGTTLIQHVLVSESRPIVLNARLEKVPFYERLGFIPTDTTFTRHGLSYTMMTFNPNHHNF
ncbi:GNAT family N-acetyltransferase [Erysipelothrix anatis]|uniref:GNAT family N-acetyltransferase n=1 Tax=Erysipelothrix anatis TaxID=2683713 RepID=UPI00135A1337|nr:GNAT family N-acetyltransferase [Erysipelothrix anatis]